jgi:hypothetical protein
MLPVGVDPLRFASISNVPTVEDAWIVPEVVDKKVPLAETLLPVYMSWAVPAAELL